MDTRAQSQTGRSNQAVEAWGARHRASVSWGKKMVATNAWSGGHRVQLRELTKLVNAEIRASRELVLGAATEKWDKSHLLDKPGSRVALADNAKVTQRVRPHRSRTQGWDCPAVWPFEGWPKVGAWWAGNPNKTYSCFACHW